MSDGEEWEIVVPKTKKRKTHTGVIHDRIPRERAATTLAPLLSMEQPVENMSGRVQYIPSHEGAHSGESPEELIEVAGEPVKNPFACFAFGEKENSSVPAAMRTREAEGGQTRSMFPYDKNANNTPEAATFATRFAPKRTGSRNAREKSCTKAENILAMSAEDLQALRRRWRGIADDPNSASEEDRRFQVMIGAVLSSRAQSTVVADGMRRLRAREGGLTIRSMASIGHEDLAYILRSVHWNKAKAKYIREGANIILRRHRGRVPRARADIMALPGIGPALGEVLKTVYDYWEADDNHDDVGGGVEKKLGTVQENSSGVREGVEPVAGKHNLDEAKFVDCCSDDEVEGERGEA